VHSILKLADDIYLPVRNQRLSIFYDQAVMSRSVRCNLAMDSAAVSRMTDELMPLIWSISLYLQQLL